MTKLLHHLIYQAADRSPDALALMQNQERFTYATLAARTRAIAAGLLSLGLERQQRVAVYLPKRPETVIGMFAAAAAGGVFVPVNPLLKAPQVGHILRDCNVRYLITSKDRLPQLQDELDNCPDLATIVVIDADNDMTTSIGHCQLTAWSDIASIDPDSASHEVIDRDMASIFYTSGSTGKPKGVVLSHRNMVAGAESVAEYLQSSAVDRMLAVLPFSFDYGFSQLSIAFHVGASVGLIDYLFPKDVISALESYSITGLAGVPPLWVQLAKLDWPASVSDRLTYITNSGGAMPGATLRQLQRHLPNSRVYLMYGLTEAFRSTYLDPIQVDRRPDSIGKAIPNNEVMVVNKNGELCAPGEPGELVHRGPLVGLGYWNDPEKTSHRFRPVPNQDPGIVLPEMSVWSGDTVRMDEEGFLYFVGRKDDMIKTSGYRVSPSEVEEAVYDSGFVAEAIAFGVPHPGLGQAIVVAATPPSDQSPDEKALMMTLGRSLPNFMVPARIVWHETLPRNPNGKIDRNAVREAVMDIFTET